MIHKFANSNEPPNVNIKFTFCYIGSHSANGSPMLIIGGSKLPAEPAFIVRRLHSRNFGVWSRNSGNVHSSTKGRNVEIRSYFFEHVTSDWFKRTFAAAAIRPAQSNFVFYGQFAFHRLKAPVAFFFFFRKRFILSRD